MKRLILFFQLLPIIIWLSSALIPLQGTAEQNNATAAYRKGEQLLLYLAILPPQPSELNNKSPLYINICQSAEKKHCAASPIVLRPSGQRIEEGITISPPIEGEWRFKGQNGSGLEFTPQKYWEANKTYNITINPKILPIFVALSRNVIAFKTPPLLPKITELKYLQDFNKPDKKLVYAQIRFNYPVEPASLEKNLTASIASDAVKLPFSIIFTSSDNTEANITIEVPPLSKEEKTLSLVINEGVSPLHGGSKMSYHAIGNQEKKEKEQASAAGSRRDRNIYKYQEQLLIPSLSSYFKVTRISLEKDVDESLAAKQTLTIETNASILTQELSRNLKVLLLPQDKPASFTRGFAQKNYRWKSTAEVTADVLKQSEEVKITPNASSEASATNSFTMNAAPGRYVLVELKKGSKSKDGFELGETFQRVLEVPAVSQEAKIMSEGSILSLAGEQKLSIYSIGVDKLYVELAKVKLSNINHLISQTYGGVQDPNFINEGSFNSYNIATIFEEVIPLNKSTKTALQYASLDLSKYIDKKATSDEGRGLFFVSLKYKNDKDELILGDRRFLLVTDLGILVKKSHDDTSDIFISSISKGQPVPKAKVEVIGLNGTAIATAETDKLGHTILPDIRAFAREKAPTAYLIKYGNDVTFMPYGRSDREVNYSKFDVRGTKTSADGLKAYMFSDRGVYRPGEIGHIGIIVKQADWGNNLKGLPLELEVLNPRGRVVDTKKLTLNEEGFVEYLFSSNETSPTGTYNIMLYITKDSKRDNTLSSTTIRVEEFLPDQMRIKAKLQIPAKSLWASPENLKAEVQLTSLYGSPAANRRVAASIILTPAHFFLPQFKEYRFFNGSVAKGHFEEKLPEKTTNEFGKIEFDLNLSSYSDATYNLNFQLEGFEPDSGRSVSASQSILVSKLPYIVGFKGNTNLSYINKQDKKSAIEFIAVNKYGQRIAVPDLKLETKKIRYINSLNKREDGTYAYQSVPDESSISKTDLSIGEQGYIHALPTAEIGEFVIYITNKDGAQLAQANFSVVGNGNLEASLSKNAILQVKTDKPDYNADEEIAVNITAPYKGFGLITVETTKVHCFQWFKAEGTSTTQKIKVPQGFEGKGFVNVQFMRSLDSKEIFMSPFTYATTPFTVGITKRDQKIALNVPTSVKPGEKLTIGYKTKQPGKIVVFAIDEGVLLFGGYKTPDALSYFIKNRALEVKTAHMLDLALPEYSMLKMASAVGGDGFMASEGVNLNPFKRKTEAPVAFWSGIIDSSQAEKTIDFDIPDYFSGTLQVMAVAAAEEAVGAAQASSIVKRDLIIKPNAPLFAAPGDEFIVTATLINNVKGSGKGAKVTLATEVSEQLELLEYPQEIAIDEEGEEILKLKLRATDKLGAASIKFTTSLGDKQVSYTSLLSVRPLAPAATTLSTAYSNGQEATAKIVREIYDKFGKVEVSVSPIPLALINGLREYLQKYPYGCTEQLVSKNFANITLYDQPHILTIHEKERKKIDEALESVFKILRERQNNDGSFGMWGPDRYTDNNSAPNDFLSVYVMHFLTEAAARNLAVPEETYNTGLSYLKQMAGKAATSLAEAREKAYAIYVLTKNNQITTRYLANVLQYLENHHQNNWKNDLAAVYIASSYKMLQMVPEADKLVAQFNLGNASLYNQTDDYEFYNNFIKHAQYTYLLSLHFPDLIKTLDKAVVYKIADFIGEGYYNSITSAYAIMGILAYTNAIGDMPDAQFEILLNAGGKDEQKLSLNGRAIKTAALAPAVKSFKVHATMPGFFYQTSIQGFDKETDASPYSKGIELTRQYLDSAGKAVTKVKIGDTIDVVLTLRSGTNDVLNNVAVVDLLPSGFELVPQPVIPLLRSWNPIYVDKREDRVIAFGSIPGQNSSYTYKIKAVNSGAFLTPPTYAEAMYIPGVYTKGTAGSIIVE